jgi:hypothetical protein
MAVGTQPTSATINNVMTALAVQLREVMAAINHLNTQVTNGVLGDGQTTLESYGYSSADASAALNLIGYFNSVSEVYYGQLQAGGTGGTGATEFDYDNALSVLWNGQF